MAGKVSNQVVTDGLVLYLDAANYKSYVSGSTVWNDLTENKNNGVLTNGPIFDPANAGSVVFDAIDDQVVVQDSLTLSNLTRKLFTISAWVYHFSGGPTGTRQTIAEKRVGVAGEGGWILSTRLDFGTIRGIILYPGRSAGLLTEAYPSDSTYGSSYFVNRWVNITMTYDSTTRLTSLYFNGVEGIYVQRFIPPVDAGLESGIMTMGWGQFSTPFKGEMSNLGIYNRILSNGEILQNYNALKWRYGL